MLSGYGNIKVDEGSNVIKNMGIQLVNKERTHIGISDVVLHISRILSNFETLMILNEYKNE